MRLLTGLILPRLLLLFFVMIEIASAAPCANCKKETEQRCAGCKAVYFCNKDCQTVYWKRHRDACKASKIYAHLSPFLERRPSTLPNAGDGLFTLRDVERGERVVAYGGSVYPTREALRVSGFLEHTTSAYGISPTRDGKEEYIIDGAGDCVDTNALRHLAGALANDICYSAEVVFHLQKAYTLLKEIPFTRAEMQVLMTEGAKLDRELMDKIQVIFLEVLQAHESYKKCEENLGEGSKPNLQGDPNSEGPLFCLLANVPIAKGSELFLAYGFQYWAMKYAARLGLTGRGLSQLLLENIYALILKRGQTLRGEPNLAELALRGKVFQPYQSVNIPYFMRYFGLLLGVCEKFSWEVSTVLADKFAGVMEQRAPLLLHRKDKEFDSTRANKSLRIHPLALDLLRYILTMAVHCTEDGATFRAKAPGETSLDAVSFLKILQEWENSQAKTVDQFAAEHPQWHNPEGNGACFLLALSHILTAQGQAPLLIKDTYMMAFSYILTNHEHFSSFVPGLSLEAYIQSLIEQLNAHVTTAGRQPHIQAPWADNMLIVAFCTVLGVNVSIQQFDQWGHEDGPPVEIQTSPGAQTVHLALFDDRHFFAPPQAHSALSASASVQAALPPTTNGTAAPAAEFHNSQGMDLFLGGLSL